MSYDEDVPIRMRVRGGPWVAAPIRLIADKRISPMARLVFQILMANENQTTGECFPGFERIATFVGLDNARSIYRPMKELEDAGYIVRSRRTNDWGHRTSDDYELCPDNPGAPTIAALREEVKVRQQKAKEQREERRKRRKAKEQVEAAAGPSARSSEQAESAPSARSSESQARVSVRAKRADSRGDIPETDLAETEQENTARGEARIDDQPASAASGRARDDLPPPAPSPSSFTAGLTGTSTLFGFASSAPNGAANPPRSARPPLPADAEDCPEFMEFWNAGPKRGARKAAYTAWRKVYRDGVQTAVIMDSWPAHVAEWANWPEADRKYIPHAATWLGQERWEQPPERRYPAGLTPVAGGGGGRSGQQTAEERRAMFRDALAEEQGGHRAGAVEGRVVDVGPASYTQPRAV